jgi:Zn finger protein HypA/HybF involved in hydrogenase expression
MIPSGAKCKLPFYCKHCGDAFSRTKYEMLRVKKYNKCPRCRKKATQYGKIINSPIKIFNGSDYTCLVGPLKRYYLENISLFCPRCKKSTLKIWSII